MVLSLGMAMVGLVLGSFGNVPIHRWPAGESITEPRHSTCPACGAPIAPRDNIPVVSWILLRARCRRCGGPIHWRYPLVELTTAILFGAVAWVHGWTGILPALLVVTWSMVVGVAIDLEHRIIPNRMTYPLAPLLLALVTLAAVLDGGAWEPWWTAVIAGLGVPTAMLAFSLLFEWLRGKPGIGMGDVKWAPSLAMPVAYVQGWMGVVIWFYGTIISGGVIALLLVLAGRAKMASRIPYGPYLALGALLALLAGDPIGAWIESRLLGT